MVCCPYGPSVLIPILLSVAGVGLNLAFTFTCNFIDVSSSSDAGVDRGFGPWTIEGTAPLVTQNKVYSSILSSSGGNVTVNVDNAASVATQDTAKFLQQHSLDASPQTFCYPYSQFGYDNFVEGSLFDNDMHVARGFSMTAVVLGVILMFNILFMSCCTIRRSGFYITGIFSILTGVFVALTLVVLNSNFCTDAAACKMGYSGIVCIVAAAVWVLLGLYMLCMNKTPRDREVGSRRAVTPEQPKAHEGVTVVTTAAGRDVESGGQHTTVVY